MFIEIGSAAEAVDGPCGRVGALLLRRSAELTHVVIDHRGHGTTARVVPATSLVTPPPGDADDAHHGDERDRQRCRLSWTKDEVDAATEADALSLVEVSHGGGAGPLHPSGAMPGIMSLSKWVGEGPDDSGDFPRTGKDMTAGSLLATTVHRNPPGTVRIDGSTPVVDLDERTVGTVVGLRLAPDLTLVGVVARPHGLQHELHHDLVEYPVSPGQHPEVVESWIRFHVTGDEIARVPFHR